MLRRSCCWLQAKVGTPSAAAAPTVSHLLEQVHELLLKPTSLDVRQSNSVVLLSNSRSVFENLALEHSLFNGLRFSDSDPTARVVVLYRNAPCVVVGHHQHMLLECQVSEARKRNIQLARRYSGGGTVFHDLGNINICVLSHRKFYRPEENIQLLRSFLISLSGDMLRGSSATLENVLKESSTSSRHDLFLEGKKVTGSAMKLGTDVAYHHFTLLVESDVGSMKGILTPKGQLRSAEYPPLPDSATGSPRKMQVGDSVNGFDTIASVSVASVPSPVTTLKDVLLRHEVPKTQLTGDSFRFTEELMQRLGVFAGSSFPFGGGITRQKGAEAENRSVSTASIRNERVLTISVDGMATDNELREHLTQLQSAAWLHKNPQFLTDVSVTLRVATDAEGTEVPITVRCTTEFQAGGVCSSIALAGAEDSGTASEVLNAVVAVLNTEMGSGNINPFLLSDQEREVVLNRIDTHSAFSFLCGSDSQATAAKKVALQLATVWLTSHRFHISPVNI